MAQVTIALNDGLKVGNDLLKSAVLRDVSAGDVIEAQEESEKLVYAVQGNKIVPTLVASPTLVGVHVLRRQIVRIGDGEQAVNGPIELSLLKQLSPTDLDALQAKANEMDEAMSAEIASREVAQRGRSDGDGGQP